MSTPKAKGRVCGGKKKSGGTCRQEAGWGTDHVGHGRCKLHGGMAPSGRKAAQRQAAEEAVGTYGLPREIDPHAALLEELHRTAGHVAWLQTQVAELEVDEVTHLIVANDHDDDKRKLEVIDERTNVWIDLYQRERKHFAAIAKTCVDVGIEERRVRLAEQEGQLIAQVLRGVLTELGVMDRPETAQIVRRHLTLVAGQAA
jgi:hypothetical protein